jgi:hypothetical protein
MDNREISMDWVEMENHDTLRMPGYPSKRPPGGLDGVFATGIAWMLDLS